MKLYLVKHSRPDITNTTQGLSKVNDGANPAAFHELHDMIKCVPNNGNFELKFKQLRNKKKLQEEDVLAIMIMLEITSAGKA